MANIEEHKALKVGTHLRSKEGDYTIEDILGMGGFGITYKATEKVYKGKTRQKHTYAIKEFFRSDICMREKDGSVSVNESQQENYKSSREAFKEEAKLLSKLPNHDGLIKVNERFDANNTSYYVMQYLDYSLEQKVQNSNGQRLSEEEALNIIRKIGNAVQVLHKENRLHLDIKPANIMFDEEEPCLIDFGNSRAYKKNGELIDKDAAVTCSSGYAPQEQYNGINSFSPAADIYALGATLLYMLTGKHPLPANEITSTYIDEVLPKDIKAFVKVTICHCLIDKRYNDISLFLTALKEDSRGGSKTEIIPGGGGSGTTGIDFTEKLAKISKLLLSLTVAILIICAIFLGGNRVITSCRSASIDSVDIQEVDTIAKDTPIVVPDPIPNPAPDTTTVKPIPTPPKPDPKPVEQILNLGWGIWHGKIIDKRPKGFGTIDIIKPQTIQDSIKVKTGEKIINCEIRNGKVYQGTIIHDNGTKETITP